MHSEPGKHGYTEIKHDACLVREKQKREINYSFILLFILTIHKTAVSYKWRSEMSTWVPHCFLCFLLLCLNHIHVFLGENFRYLAATTNRSKYNSWHFLTFGLKVRGWLLFLKLFHVLGWRLFFFFLHMKSKKLSLNCTWKGTITTAGSTP